MSGWCGRSPITTFSSAGGWIKSKEKIETEGTDETGKGVQKTETLEASPDTPSEDDIDDKDVNIDTESN